MSANLEGVQQITVSTADGAALALRLLPQADPAAPVVLVLPAMAIKAKYYLPLITALHAAGLTAAVLDLRAQGESTPALGEGPGFGYRELIEVDLPAVVTELGERFPAAPVHLFGHSLGGQLSLLFAAAEPGRVASVTTIGTGSVYWWSFEPARRLEVLARGLWVGVVTRVRGRWPGGGGIGPMTAGVMADWARHLRTGRYRPSGSARDYDRLLAELTRPVLLISLDGDPLGPEATVRYLMRKLAAAEPVRWHIDRASGLTHLGHASWVKDSDKVAPVVADWIVEGRAPQRREEVAR